MNKMCVVCNGPLTSIGLQRKNGKDNKYISNHKCHKKCFSEYLSIQRFNKDVIALKKLHQVYFEDEIK